MKEDGQVQYREYNAILADLKKEVNQTKDENQTLLSQYQELKSQLDGFMKQHPQGLHLRNKSNETEFDHQQIIHKKNKDLEPGISNKEGFYVEVQHANVYSSFIQDGENLGQDRSTQGATNQRTPGTRII